MYGYNDYGMNKEASFMDALRSMSKEEILALLKSKEGMLAAGGLASMLGLGAMGGMEMADQFNGEGGFFEDDDLFNFSGLGNDMLSKEAAFLGLGRVGPLKKKLLNAEILAAELDASRMGLMGDLGSHVTELARAKDLRNLLLLAPTGGAALGLGGGLAYNHFAGSNMDLLKMADAAVVANAIAQQTANTQQANTEAQAQALQALIAVSQQEEGMEMGVQPQMSPEEEMMMMQQAQAQQAQPQMSPEEMAMMQQAQAQAQTQPQAPAVAADMLGTVEQKAAYAFNDLLARL